MTSPRRLDVATALREAFEDRRIRIHDDDDLRRDLHAVRTEDGPTGAPRLAADRGDTDGHADRFWALALAVSAASGGLPEYDYRPVGSDPRRPRLPRGYDDGDRDRDVAMPDKWSPWISGSASAAFGRR